MKEYPAEDQFARQQKYMGGYKQEEFDSIGLRNQPMVPSQHLRRETGPKVESMRRQGDLMDRRNMQMDDEDDSSEPAGNAFLQESRIKRGTEDLMGDMEDSGEEKAYVQHQGRPYDNDIRSEALKQEHVRRPPRQRPSDQVNQLIDARFEKGRQRQEHKDSSISNYGGSSQTKKYRELVRYEVDEDERFLGALDDEDFSGRKKGGKKFR